MLILFRCLATGLSKTPLPRKIPSSPSNFQMACNNNFGDVFQTGNKPKRATVEKRASASVDDVKGMDAMLDETLLDAFLSSEIIKRLIVGIFSIVMDIFIDCRERDASVPHPLDGTQAIDIVIHIIAGGHHLRMGPSDIRSTSI